MSNDIDQGHRPSLLPAPLSGPLVMAETLGGRKSSTKATKTKNQSNKDRYLFKRRDETSDIKATKTILGHACSSLSSAYEDGASDTAAASYVFQKRDSAIFNDVPGEIPTGDQVATSAHAGTTKGSPIAGLGVTVLSASQALKPDAVVTADLGNVLDKIDRNISNLTSADAVHSGTMDGMMKKKKKAAKPPAGKLSSENSDRPEKKVKKPKKIVGQRSIEHVEGDSAVSGGAVKSAGMPFEVTASSREDSQVKQWKKDNEATNSVVSASSEAAGGNDGQLPQMLADLRGLALNPVNGMESNGPAITRQFFLKFRSSGYLKSSSASTSAESEPSEQQAVRSTSASEPGDKPSIESSKPVSSLKLQKKLSARPEDSVKGRKQILSERQGEFAVERAKNITEVKSLSADKRGLQKNPEMWQRTEGKTKVDAAQSSQTKLFKSEQREKKADRPLKVEEPTYLIMKYQSDSSLPSPVELSARFARFGPLDISLSRVCYKTNTCRVAFLYKEDANVACCFAMGSKSVFSNVKFFVKAVAAREAQQPSSAKTEDLQTESAASRDSPVGESRPLVPTATPQQLRSCLKKPSGCDETGSEAEIPSSLESIEKTPEQDGDLCEEHHPDSCTKGVFQRMEIPVNKVCGMIKCTSDSYDFINQAFNIDRGGEFLDATVAVIDGLRKMVNYCNRDELTFLTDSSGLVEYDVPTGLCGSCYINEVHTNEVGISSHGYFCAAIISSRKITEARLEELYLGEIRGVSPPPRIAIFGIGCRSCFRMVRFDVIDGFRAAIDKRVDIISMSLALHVPEGYNRDALELEVKIIQDETLDAFANDILTVIPAGNDGRRLGSVAMSAPWCLSVASCTSKRVFKTLVDFRSGIEDNTFSSLLGFSKNMLPSTDWFRLRNMGEICDRSSMMYLCDADGCVVIKEIESIRDSPSDTPLVYFTKEQSTTISQYLDMVNCHGAHLEVYIHSSSRVEIVDSPLVSEFSGRGPCNFYGDFMKPDVIAPGEHIAAAWPADVPLKGSNPPRYVNFNVQSGTSHAAPQVAAAAAILRSELKFSASAICSALITTARKMHGKDRVAYEYAYGAGVVDVKRAMRPGLVYEEVAGSYADYIAGTLPHYDLNLPYFSASLPVDEERWQCTFRRKVKSLEEGKCTYRVTFEVHAVSFDMSQSDVQISSTPSFLEFEEYGSEAEFTVFVALPHSRVARDSFGLISGSVKLIHEDNDEIVVNSPLIISSKCIPPSDIINGLYKTLHPPIFEPSSTT